MIRFLPIVVLVAACSVNEEGGPVVEIVDAQPQSDASVEADASNALCVSSIRLPTQTDWSLSVEFTDGRNTLRVPYACPSGTEAAQCRFALIQAERLDGSGHYVYPKNDACRVAVPVACLPCTRDVTAF